MTASTMTDTFHADADDLTVYRTDANGETFDLNAHGAPCADAGDLKDFIAELHGQGAYDAATRDALLEDL